MRTIPSLILSCLFAVGSVAVAQTTTQENLGVITTAQVRSGLGWEINGNNTSEFAAAAAAGATHVRIDACTWSNVEKQTPPPNNASLGYALPTGCSSALENVKRYNLKATMVAGFGSPFHQIMTLELTAPGKVGDTSISVQLVSGVGGKNIHSIVFPYDYVENIDTVPFTAKYTYEGSFITGITFTGSESATLHLSSAINVPQNKGTKMLVNELLYPSAPNGNVNDASVRAYARYAEFLASQMRNIGVSGDVEIWNEPPWRQDCWDNRTDCYDVDPKIPNALRANSGNIGFAAALQHITPIPGVNFTWAGTNKGSSADLLGSGMQQYAGTAFAQPQAIVTAESFHPYGSNPEDAMWNEPCLEANPKFGQGCNTTGGSSNFVLTQSNNLIARAKGSNYGIQHTITETGASTLYMPADHLARFVMRQYLGFMADDISVVEFYRLYDRSTPGQSGFGFMSSTDAGASLSPLPHYTAIAGLMSDLDPVSGKPVASYSAATLPSVTSYKGTYNLDHLTLVGAKSGDKQNSVAYMLWQRSYSPKSCYAGDLTPCWGTLGQPASAQTTVKIPSGLKVQQVINLDTRRDVVYKQTGASLVLAVSDDPIEILLIPTSDPSIKTTPTLFFPAIASQKQGVTMPVTATSNSPGAISYAVLSGGATLSGNVVTLHTASSVVIQATQAASGSYATAKTTVSFNVIGVAPKLAFNGIGSKTFGDSIAVKASSASTGAVTYSVVSGPATISGTTVKMTGSGTVTLGAKQAAAGAYTPATATISFHVSPKSAVLAFTPVTSVVFGHTESVTAKSISSAPVIYTVVSGVGTISGNVVTPTSEGQVYLKATQAATNQYTGSSTLTNFHVNAAVPPLSLGGIPTKGYNASFQVKASSPSKGGIFYSVVSGPARISGTTVTTLSTAGTVVIKATQQVSGGYNSATTTTSFKVTASGK